ncbi:MAG: GNAT family N-acetyltransferase [Acidimicrobiales bacterium]
MSAGVRRAEASDIDAWVAAMGVGFLIPVADGYAEYYAEEVDLDRTWGAYDGDRVVGTLRSFATTLTVPGPAQVVASALTNVTVSPTHRRRGLLTDMMLASLRADAARGEPVSILIASEYPIYGRFGYGAAIEGAAYSLDVPTTRFRRPPAGEVELVDRDVMRAVAPGVYERFRATRPGSIDRAPRWWDRTFHQVDVPGDKPFEGYHALYRSSRGEPEGYVSYSATNRWEHMRKKGELTVEELVAATPAAYERLWRHCCEVDLITVVHAGDRCIEEPLAWLLEDGRALRRTGTFDFVWVRVLDTAAALSARRYRVAGALVVEIVDPLGLAAGRMALQGGPDGATCTPTSRSPDLTMPVDTLGSLYVGGTSALALADAGRIDEHRAGAVLLADAMFGSPLTPWCATWF